MYPYLSCKNLHVQLWLVAETFLESSKNAVGICAGTVSVKVRRCFLFREGGGGLKGLPKDSGPQCRMVFNQKPAGDCGHLGLLLW